MSDKPVAGTLLEANPQIPPEMVKEDGTNRVTRSGTQNGAAVWLVTLGLYIAQQVGWEGEMPPEVASALTGLIALTAAFLMNRKRIKGKV